MPKPALEDYVIVIKPQERVSLHEAYTKTSYGTAISAYLEPEWARAISVLPSRDQNIVIVRTMDVKAADRLIGDFPVNIEKGSIPLQGYLRQDGGNMCHGVIVDHVPGTAKGLAEPTKSARVTAAQKKDQLSLMFEHPSLARNATNLSAAPTRKDKRR
ncbi:hypothetical protein HPB47_016869 [Ixodes persulcatus]|uniref:Uncharacterized protein n=1 Tax=Ixodes persulcatus TaxID=34615 RepID=A0AC60QPS6_IXOPE|nr:hypothetical protein HPB47_016869 [Ixodes persulcatus]